MRKKSHISLAKFLLHSNKEHKLFKHKKAFYIGSILPDLKPSFLTRRHTIEETFDILTKEIKGITVDYDFRKGISMCYARRLGVITHYLADYFTFPHNSSYTGSMTDHVYYEKEMKYQLKEYVKAEINNFGSNQEHMLDTFDKIVQFIKTTHKEYLEALKAVKQDIHYIIKLCSKVVASILCYFNVSLEELQASAEPSFQL